MAAPVTTMAPSSMPPTSVPPTSIAPTSVAPASIAEPAIAQSECYDRRAVSVAIRNTAPAVAPPVAVGAATPVTIAVGRISPVHPWPPSSGPSAPEPPTSVAPTSVSPTSVAPPAVAPVTSAMSPTASEPDEVDRLRRLAYVRHNWMRLHDGSLNRYSKQHRCSCGCSQNRRSHSHFHFKSSYQQCARTIRYIISHEQDLSVDLDQIRWLDTRN